MNTKISEAQQVLREMEAGAVALLPDPASDVIRGWAQRLHAALPHLQGEAVPAAFCKDGVLFWYGEYTAHRGENYDLYTHPQSAALNEVSGDFGELGGQLPAFGINTANHAGIRIRGYTAQQMQDYARAALAATGKQQVGEVQGDALLESLVARWRKDADEVGTSDNTLCQKIANCTMRHAAELQAVIAARQPWPKCVLCARFDVFNAGDVCATCASQPAQGIDLEQFRECVELMEWQERGHANPDFPAGDPKKHAEALRLLALIDGQRDAAPGVES